MLNLIEFVSAWISFAFPRKPRYKTGPKRRSPRKLRCTNCGSFSTASSSTRWTMALAPRIGMGGWLRSVTPLHGGEKTTQEHNCVASPDFFDRVRKKNSSCQVKRKVVDIYFFLTGKWQWSSPSRWGFICWIRNRIRWLSDFNIENLFKELKGFPPTRHLNKHIDAKTDLFFPGEKKGCICWWEIFHPKKSQLANDAILATHAKDTSLTWMIKLLSLRLAGGDVHEVLSHMKAKRSFSARCFSPRFFPFSPPTGGYIKKNTSGHLRKRPKVPIFWPNFFSDPKKGCS